MALDLLPARALLNDINPHVINFYARLKRGLVITMPMRKDEAFLESETGDAFQATPTHLVAQAAQRLYTFKMLFNVNP